MDMTTIFGVQFLLSLVVFSLIARWYLSPLLVKMPSRDTFSLLMLPHTFRHIGLVFLVPGLVGEGLSRTFAVEAAYGDLVSAILALLSVIALQGGFRFAIAMVAATNVVGLVDLISALSQASVIPQLGVAWFIPTFIVPVLVVTHFMMLMRLYCMARQQFLPSAKRSLSTGAS